MIQEADGHVLPESSAILKYLAQKYSVAGHFYPGDAPDEHCSPGVPTIYRTEHGSNSVVPVSHSTCIAQRASRRTEFCIRCHSGNLQQRARVDSALDWHHWAVRRGAAGQVWNRILAPMSGQGGSEDVAEASVGILRQALQVRTGLVAL